MVDDAAHGTWVDGTFEGFDGRGPMVDSTIQLHHATPKLSIST